MTDASVPSSGTPHEILAGVQDLTRRVRAAQRGTWIPLLLLGLLTLGGVLADRLTFSVTTVPCPEGAPPDPGGVGCTMIRQGSPLYWTVGLLLAYAATAVLYVRRSARRGVGTPVRPYVVAGAFLVCLVAATTFWGARQDGPGATLHYWGMSLDPHDGLTVFLARFTGDAATMGLPLLVLAWVERNRALLLFGLAYLVLVLAPISTGWAGIDATSPWSALPRLAVPAAFLLLGSLAFALAQRPRPLGAS